MLQVDSHVQALMLDAMAPLSEVMEVFHSEAEEVSLKLVAKAVEDAITLIGNASFSAEDSGAPGV